jgi:uncharacterized protein (TIGR00251 family)
VRVVPNANSNEVVGVYGDSIKIKVQAPAMDGKANEALLDYVAKKLVVPRGDVFLVTGEKSREKSISVSHLASKEVKRRLLSQPPE